MPDLTVNRTNRTLQERIFQTPSEKSGALAPEPVVDAIDIGRHRPMRWRGGGEPGYQEWHPSHL